MKTVRTSRNSIITKATLVASMLTFSFFSCQKQSENIVPQSTEVTYSNARVAAVPAISGIGGASMPNFTSDGKWLGNVPACGRGSFYDFYVINTHDNSDALNYWDIKGSNFGTTRGSVGSNSTAITFDILSWSNTSIRVRPKVGYQLDVKTNFTVTVTNSDRSFANRSINIIGMIANGRGYGQCTWEAAYQRKLMGLSIPWPSAYSYTKTITSAYVPQKGDVLHWKGHTGIILSSPTSTTLSGVVTYSFTIRERNSKCNENNATQTTQTFKRSSAAIVQGISSDNAGLGKALTYWR